MIDKLWELKKEYDRLSEEVATPASRDQRYQRSMRRIKELDPIIRKFDELLKVEKELIDAKEVLAEHKEGELAELAREELREASRHMGTIKKTLSSLLPVREGQKDAGQTTGVIVEIRAGTGGEEAALFARDLFEMYSRFAEKKDWKRELMDCHRSEMGGFKEMIFGLEGRDVYNMMRHEGGVHRVQRIPVTESGGRIHTSTVTVAVLPEMEEKEVQIEAKDLRTDVFRASGAGGQHVNVTDSAVRITHLPTGITVQCQDERSQHKNRAKAMRVLRARVSQLFREKKQMQIAKDRSAQVKTGERSQKIRTYNFPRNRVTDHRINLTIQKLQSVMKGDLDQLMRALAQE